MNEIKTRGSSALLLLQLGQPKSTLRTGNVFLLLLFLLGVVLESLPTFHAVLTRLLEVLLPLLLSFHLLLLLDLLLALPLAVLHVAGLELSAPTLLVGEKLYRQRCDGVFVLQRVVLVDFRGFPRSAQLFPLLLQLQRKSMISDD